MNPINTVRKFSLNIKCQFIKYCKFGKVIVLAGMICYLIPLVPFESGIHRFDKAPLGVPVHSFLPHPLKLLTAAWSGVANN